MRQDRPKARRVVFGLPPRRPEQQEAELEGGQTESLRQRRRAHPTRKRRRDGRRNMKRRRPRGPGRCTRNDAEMVWRRTSTNYGS